MGICANELRDYVIIPTLKYLGDYSEMAANLLLGTAAQESGLGFHLKQAPNKAIGLYQIHPHTHTSLWNNYLSKNPDLASKVRGLASQHEFLSHPHAELATNLAYATAIAWIIYNRKNIKLSKDDNLESLAKTWQRHYHSKPFGQSDDFIRNYRLQIQTAA
jgi:hypothetical protein